MLKTLVSESREAAHAGHVNVSGARLIDEQMRRPILPHDNTPRKPMPLVGMDGMGWAPRPFWTVASSWLCGLVLVAALVGIWVVLP